jgi:predicted RNA methylase
MDIEEKFVSGDGLICPKCKSQLTVEDVDYRRAGLWCTCNKCGRSFDIPVPTHFCRNCQTNFTFENAKIREAYKYRLNEDVVKTAASEWAILAPIRKLLVDKGFKVETPGFMEGRSGVKHMFDIIAYNNGRKMIEAMILPETGYVLDMGCGYGAIGIAAAKLNPKLHVIMVDVNERAVRIARQNIRINGIYNAEVRKGHLYQPVENTLFHCILSNPPLSAGLAIVKAIITEAPKHMAEKATLQMVLKSKICGKRLQKIFEETFGYCTILARESGYRVLMAENARATMK